MIQRLFAVRDGKVEQFFPPMSFRTPGGAQRWFTDIVNNSKSELFKHPGDYALYEVGSFESDNGEVARCVVVLTCTGLDVLDVSDVGVRQVSDA